eukprot:127951_1
MSETSKMVVSGYIRIIIEPLLKNSSLHLIPTSVVLLCYDFYSSQIMLCIAFIAHNARKKNAEKFGIIDHESGNISKYQLFTQFDSLYQFNTNNYISSAQSPHCFVPNISSKLTNLSPTYFHNINIKRKSYHGIFSLLKQSDANQIRLNPYFSLFKSSNVREQNYFHELVSTKQLVGSPQKGNGYHFDWIKEPNCVLFCGRDYGIIYEWNKKLYQLDLKTIDSDNFEFKPMGSYNNNQWKHQTLNKMYSQSYLSMQYLNNIEKLFAIYCQDSYGQPSNTWNTIRQYGIYDLQQEKWTTINTCPFNISGNFRCSLCYESDIVYMVRSSGPPVLYYCEKDEWIELKKGGLWRGEGIIWIDKYDPNLLCYAYQNFKSVQISKLDMRANSKEWVETDTVSPRGSVRLFK